MKTESTNAITDVSSVKQHPILFSTPMVQAILEGRKTQTRRVVKPQPPTGCEDNNPIIDWCDYDNVLGWQKIYATWETKLHPDGFHCVVSPYGRIGDVLWVRETFAKCIGRKEITPSEMANAYEWNPNRFIVYKADSKEDTHPDHPEWGKKSWKPSIHMPKSAARIWLRISNIRVERLQDISREDAIAEGIVPDRADIPFKPQSKFFHLWESINGEQSLINNPWVWVIEFYRIEKPRTF